MLQTGLVTSPGELSGSSQPALGPSVLPPMVADIVGFVGGFVGKMCFLSSLPSL